VFGLCGKKKDANTLANDKLRAALAREGDDGTAPRHVLHFVWPEPGGEKHATVVLDYLVAKGLSVDPGKANKGYIGEETREVASAGFDTRTAELKTATQGWGWAYDGWECAVIVRPKEN